MIFGVFVFRDFRKAGFCLKWSHLNLGLSAVQDQDRGEGRWDEVAAWVLGWKDFIRFCWPKK